MRMSKVKPTNRWKISGYINGITSGEKTGWRTFIEEGGDRPIVSMVRCSVNGALILSRLVTLWVEMEVLITEENGSTVFNLIDSTPIVVSLDGQP
jgi:hypothetical protein